MLIRIDPNADSPVYAQIVRQVKFGVASGTLRSREHLPSVRELASELRINPNTVARAYRELEHEGLVETQWGRGMFVASEVGRLPKSQRLELLSEKLQQLVQDARRLGLTEKDLHALLSECHEALQRASPSSAPVRK